MAERRALPLTDLLLRVSGYGCFDKPPDWIEFCAPTEREMLEDILKVGQVRSNLRQQTVECDDLGKKGNFLVASVAMRVREITNEFDSAIVELSRQARAAVPPTLHSVFATTSELEPSLTAMTLLLVWILRESRQDKLFDGSLLDECFRRLESSHGRAKLALDKIFQSMFETFKRMMMSWLAFGFINSRNQTFFIREPADCQLSFLEISAITDRSKAPAHYSQILLDKIAQCGYMRKFLGWRSKNQLNDPDLENAVTHQINLIRNLSWKDYRTDTLEIFVDGVVEVYSGALYKNIFERCRIAHILKSFHQMYLLGLVGVFDAFIELAEVNLREPATMQALSRDANMKFDRAFEGLEYSRTYSPGYLTGKTSFRSEEVIENDFSCFNLTLSTTSPISNATGWEVLNLQFPVGHPLDWFFHKQAMDKYRRIFRHLLRLRRVSNALGLLWGDLRAALTSGRLSIEEHSLLFHWHHVFLQVFSTIHGFMKLDVIDLAWAEFQKLVTRSNDFVQLVEAQNQFLDVVLSGSMMENTTLYKYVCCLAKSTMEVCIDISNQLVKPMHAALNLSETKDKMQDLDHILLYLIKCIQNEAEKDPEVKYSSLSFKLDYNQFFELADTFV